MTRLYVKPGEGRAVPDPEYGGELLPAEGRAVPNSSYWQRRLTDQDVVVADPPADPMAEVPETETPEPADAPDQAPARPKAVKRSAAQ